MDEQRLAATFREIAQSALTPTMRQLWERAAAACEAEPAPAPSATPEPCSHPAYKLTVMAIHAYPKQTNIAMRCECGEAVHKRMDP